VKLYAVATVRNEADIVDVSIRFHLQRGVDRFLVIDNGSGDGTTRSLQRLARDGRVRWTRDESPFRPAEMHTALAREAAREGADWVMYIDADEFWTPVARSQSLKDVLDAVRAGLIEVPVITFVQDRRQARRRRAALRLMDRRVEVPAGSPETHLERVEAREIAYVEIWSSKVIVRASEAVAFVPGGHDASGYQPPEREVTDAIVCMHAPLRSREVLEARAKNGPRADLAGRPDRESWHVRRWHRFSQNATLMDAEWAANSHAAGALDIGDTCHGLIRDTRLRDAVTPLLGIHRFLPAPLVRWGAFRLPTGAPD
jgi:hypothetical protein